MTLGALHERARALKGALERYDAALRIALQDGPIAMPDGRRLELRERQIERIKPREAWGIIEGAIGLDAMAEAITISKTEIMRAVGDLAPRGQKGRAQAALAQALRDAGAIETETQTRVEVDSRPLVEAERRRQIEAEERLRIEIEEQMRTETVRDEKEHGQ